MTGPITETVKAFLESNNVKHEYVEQSGCFRTGFKLDNCDLFVILHADDERKFLYCHTGAQGTLPVDNARAVISLINEINLTTRFTTMCFNPSDGELTCHSGVNTDGTTISKEQIGGLLSMCCGTIDENLEKLRQTAMGATPVTLN